MKNRQSMAINSKKYLYVLKRQKTLRKFFRRNHLRGELSTVQSKKPSSTFSFFHSLFVASSIAKPAI